MLVEVEEAEDLVEAGEDVELLEDQEGGVRIKTPMRNLS
jgi:hypothetical protein